MAQHDALLGHTPKSTPQSEPIPGSDQVPNSAGGYTWEVDVWERVRRFLILGVEGGTYYIDQRKLVTENTAALDAAVKADGPRLVGLIIDISDNGRAPSNDPALFALAYCAKKGDDLTRTLAHNALPKVARTGTHLFHFASYVKALGGFGRGTRRAISDWYMRDIDKVAYQVIKYRQRDGWTHRDLLRLSHAFPESRDHNRLFEWITKGGVKEAGERPYLPEKVLAYEAAQQAETPAQSAQLVRVHDLPREAIQTGHLNSPEVWDALLENMPYTAMLRNLATMTRIGVLEGGNENTRTVANTISDKDIISSARVHPIAILAALKTYQQGYSMRGGNTWNAIGNIVDALDAAFYNSFGNVEPTGKRTLLALDVSGSMSTTVNGIEGLTAREASVAMALVTANVEPVYEIVGFTAKGSGGYWRSDTELTELDITPRQRLDDAVAKVARLDFGGTDCALPMIWANERNRQFDAFAVYTDNETWAGDIHPSQALIQYRKDSGIDARLAVLGTASNGFSIADPNDAGMLDVVGFDSNTPAVISEFISGTL